MGMARVIEFYIPQDFRKPLSRWPQVECGVIIEICSQIKKSAWQKPAFELIQEKANEAHWV
jgi:hypothetical protein